MFFLRMRFPRWVQIRLAGDYDADYITAQNVNHDGYGEIVELELEYQDWILWASPHPSEEDEIPGDVFFSGSDFEWVSVLYHFLF